VLDGFKSSYQHTAQRAIGIPEDILKGAIATPGEERRVCRCAEEGHHPTATASQHQEASDSTLPKHLLEYTMAILVSRSRG
jgi:hypothetical protein